MKFNFRKVASVLASAVMLGSTLGIAAAANYPAPFVQGGAANVAIVYGANANVFDGVASGLLQSDLGTELARETATSGTAGGAVGSGGDNVAIQSASDKLNIGENLTTVRTTKLTSSDMPNLLAKKTYRSYDSQSYDYEQELQIQPGLAFTHFQDTDLNNNAPSLGVWIPSSTPVMNYTLTFTTPALSDVDSNGRLEDLQNTKLTILGKEYTLLNAYNASTYTKFELMAGATTGTLNLNEEQTMTVGTKSYAVKMTFIDSSTAKFTVNGEATQSIAKGGVFKLSDGTQIGVRDISYQNFAGGVMASEISLGAEKLTLEDTQTVELNDKDVTGLTTTVSRSTSGSRVSISSVRITWKTDDEQFLIPDKSLTMPGLGSVKLAMANLTAPAIDTVKILNDGSTTVQVRAPLKDGDVAINILYSSDGANFTRIGKEGTGSVNLVTVQPGNNLIFDSDTDMYFVASWNSSTAGESYLLDAKTSQDSTVNYTTIRELLSGKDPIEKCKVQTAQTCTIGNVVLTVNQIDYLGHFINVTISSGSFNKLWTKSGLLMYLPTNISLGAGANMPGAINLTSNAGLNQKYPIQFFEMDQNNAIMAGKAINISVGAWTTDGKVQVSSNMTGNQFVGTAGSVLTTNLFETTSGSQIKVGYVPGVLGTKVIYDQSPTQDTATLEYHGGETFGNVFVAATDVTLSGGGAGTGGQVTGIGNVIVKDTEVSSVATKNLVVVGGSCINSVAARILGSTTPVCGAAFSAVTNVSSGQALVKVVDAATAGGTAGKVAMLIAGYEAADTTKAVTWVTTEKPTTDVSTVKRLSTSNVVSVL